MSKHKDKFWRPECQNHSYFTYLIWRPKLLPLINYSGVLNRRACLLIYFSFFADLTYAYLALPFYFFRGHLAACTKFKSDRPTETIKCVNVDFFTCHLWALCHLISVYMAVIIHILHDENQSLLNKPKIICNPDLIFGLAEHLVTLTLYTALPLYHLEEM